MRKVGWPGKGYKFTCHRCGFWFSSNNTRKEWTGIQVCHDCFETRHPQTLIKIHGEKAFPHIVSKDGTDTFAFTCGIDGSSPYADMGTADCMTADKTTPSYLAILGLSGNGHAS